LMSVVDRCKQRFFSIFVVLGFLVGLSGAYAQEGQPLLTISGDISGTEPMVLDAEALLDLPQVEIRTSTLWTDGLETFSGPSLMDVLALAGAGSGDLELIALNDYSVILPRDLVEPSAPILAIHRNGERFSVRDKGPLWVIFPFDRSNRYRTEQVYALSVWQLAEISVSPGE